MEEKPIIVDWQTAPYICRCCLSVGCYKDMWTEYFWMGKKEVYSEMLLDIFNVTISEQDSHSRGRLICEVCVTRLRDAASFKYQVLKNEGKFLEHVHEIQLQELPDPPSEVKTESTKDELMELNVVQGNDDDFSSVDDETLGHLKVEKYLKSLRPKNKSSTTQPKRQKRQTKKKITVEVPSSSKKTPKGTIAKMQELPEVNEMRENTLKLLKNSNICIFSWQRNRYKCFCCKQTYTKITELRSHSQTDHDFEDFETRIIQKNSYLKADVSTLKCQLCMKMLTFLNDLNDHLKEHNVIVDNSKHLLIPYKLIDKNFDCQICMEKFQVFHNLNIHMSVHFQNHICECCGKGFHSKTNLKAHSHRHGKKTHKCIKCCIEFKTLYEKEQHSVFIHKNLHKRVCQFCPERFNGHYSRLVHMINVHGFEKPQYKCNSCEKSFIRQFLLNSHIRKHHVKEKNHECAVCGMRFFEKFDLGQHMTTHTGEKNHVCGACGKAYARKGSLRDHMKIHN